VKKILSFILVFSIILSVAGIVCFAEDTLQKPSVVAPIEEDESFYPVEYVEVASNSESILYADMKYGFFALQNRETGHIWYSTPNDVATDTTTKGADKWNLRSHLTVNYIYEEDILSAVAVSSTNSQQGCVENGSVNVKTIADGIRVEYNFGDIGVMIPVEYVIKGASLIAKIDVAKIDEGKKALITDINLLPAFGAGNSSTDGQLFVPDGCGALIDFNNGVVNQTYEKKIYGDDLIVIPELDRTVDEEIRLPVFATMVENNALMGVVTAGDGSASIKALNGHETRAYNAISSVFNVRSLENLVMFETKGRRVIGRLTSLPKEVDTYEVRYTMLSGDKADYVGVAECYRNYLIEEKGLKKSTAKPSLSLELYGAIDVKAAFLGFEYSKIKALTTFSQAEKIVKSITEKTDAPVAVRYLGFSNYGLLNKKTPTNANAMSSLGGNKGFKSLQKLLDEQDSVLYADFDIVRYRKGSKNKAVKDVFNQPVEHTERLRSVYATKLDLDPVMLLAPDKLYGAANKILKAADKKDISAISLSTLGNMIYSNSSEKARFHRYSFPSEAEKIFAAYKKAGINLSVEGGNAYALPYVSRVYNSPTVSSGYNIFNKEIPFYQIVLHGYVALTTTPMAQSIESNTNLLQTVESGSEFLYGGMYRESSEVTNTRYDHLYATEYTLWIDKAIENINRYYPTLKAIADSVITDHYEYLPDVMVTEYGEGSTKIVVNYTNEDVVFDGQTVKAQDYEVLEYVGGGN